MYNLIYHKSPFNGWALIMIVILISSGLVMLMLGIGGEYLWRTYDEVRIREKFIFKDIIEKD